MEELTNPAGGDLLRELILIVAGLIIRAIEKRKLKKALQDAQS
jgi:hypothetical protein